MAGYDNIKDKGFDKRPENINTTGLNKGSRWKSTLLKDIMEVEATEKAFEKFMSKFPNVFNGSLEKNHQLYMELLQVGLLYSDDEKVVQTAIEKIKDRIDGKPKTKDQEEPQGDTYIQNNNQFNFNFEDAPKEVKKWLIQQHKKSIKGELPE